VRIIQRGGSHG
jgi:hypothetical protein